MTGFVDLIVQTAADHRIWAYALAYLLAMAEALPIVGTVVPGSIVIVGLGALIPGGTLDPWLLLAWATLGAITGDGASYWLGRRYHEEISRVWPFRRHPDLIAKGITLFRTHGGKAVFASRFIQGPRAFVPLAAGIVGMPAHRFFAMNILSALIWAPSHILAGALIGGSIALAGAVAGRLAVLLVLAIAFALLAVWLVRRGLRLVPQVWSRVEKRATAWARTGDTWAHRWVIALVDPGQPEGRALVLFAALLVGATWVFFGVLEDIVMSDPLVRVDATVYHFFQGLRTPWADQPLIAVTELGDAVVIAAVAGAVALWLALRRAWRAAAYWTGGLLLASASDAILKATLHLPRPAPPYVEGSAFSFPSGHVMMSAVLWGVLSILIAREAKPRWWPWIFGTSVGIVFLIAFSRLYLGAQWLSDVIGGLAFATAWVALLSIAYLRHRPQRVGAKALAAIALGVFVTAGFAHVHGKLPEDAGRYAVRAHAIVVPLEAWRKSRWRGLPALRVDLEGEYEEPLTVQWAGGLDRLKGELSRRGWRVAAPWSVSGVLSWISSRTAPDALPVLSKLHDGRFPALTLIKTSGRLPVGAARLVLRFWNSGLQVTVAGKRRVTVWIGEVVAEKISRPFRLFSITRTLSDFNTPLAALEKSLPSDEFVARKRSPEAGWNGRLLLGGWRQWAQTSHD